MNKFKTGDLVWFFDIRKTALTRATVHDIKGNLYSLRFSEPVYNEDGQIVQQREIEVLKTEDVLFASEKEAWVNVIATTEARRAYASRAHLQAEGELIRTSKVLRAARSAMMRIVTEEHPEDQIDCCDFDCKRCEFGALSYCGPEQQATRAKQVAELKAAQAEKGSQK